MSAAAAHTPLFNTETTIDPEATFVYEYRLPLDSPRRFDWFFYVEDPQQGSSTRVVEFWCEALWELDEGGCRTDVIHPHRQFTAGQLHSDFECVYNVAGRADVRFCWANKTKTPRRLHFTVTGTRLRSAGAISRASVAMAKEEDLAQLETRVVREVDTALAAVHDMIVSKAPGFGEEDMRAVLFTAFKEARRPPRITQERWSFLHALASCALSQRGSAEEYGSSDRVQPVELDKLVCGTQGWRYFVHKKMEETRAPGDDRWFDDGPVLGAKRPEAVSKLRMSMVRSSASLHDLSSPGPARQSMKPVGIFAQAAHRMTTGADAHPPECVCQKMKPKMKTFKERRIKIDGVSLFVYKKDGAGSWEATPRGSSIQDLQPDFMKEQKCTVVQSETTFFSPFNWSGPWNGEKKMIVVYTPLDGTVALENGTAVREKDLPAHYAGNGGGGRFAFHSETEFNRFWHPLLNLSEGRPWNCSQAQALREMQNTKVAWWSVDDVEEWVALLGLRRWPHDETFCAQQAVRSCSINGTVLLSLSVLSEELALQTLSSQLEQTSVARRSAIDTTKLAKTLLQEIGLLTQDQLQLQPEPEPEVLEPEPEIPEGTAPYTTRLPEPEPEPESELVDGTIPVEPEPQPADRTQTATETETELEPTDSSTPAEADLQPLASPEEVEAQLQLVLSQTPSWAVHRFGHSERLPAETTRLVQFKFEEYKRARGELDDRQVEEIRDSRSFNPVGLARAVSRRTEEITVDLHGGPAVINFKEMAVKMSTGAGDTRSFPIRYSRREPSEVKDATNFADRRQVLALLCTSESDYVDVLTSLREVCFAPVAEKVAERQCGPFDQCDAFAALLSLHTEFAVQLRELPSPLPVAAEVRVLQLLDEYFKRMPPIWAAYLQYEPKDILQMLSVAQIRHNDVQLRDLTEKSTQRIVELSVLIKKLSHMAPPEQLYSVQACLDKVLDRCGAHPSITAQQQLHLPLSSSPMTGLAVPNCCLWLMPIGFDKHIGHETWTVHQRRSLGGLRHMYWAYPNEQEVHAVVDQAKHFVATQKDQVLCLILVQAKFEQRRSSVSQMDEHAAMLPRPYSGLDEHCTVFSQHNLDTLVVFGDNPTASECQHAAKNVISDRIREKQAEAFDKQALVILARGETEFEHVFELEDRIGMDWVPSRAVVTKRGLLKKIVGSVPQSAQLLQGRVVSLSANELKWSGGRIDTTHITQVNRRLAWDKHLEGYGFEVYTNVAQVTTVHMFLTEKMHDRDSWVASIDKVLKSNTDQRQPLTAFCREDFAFRDSPEDLLLPIERDAQWVFVGEWRTDLWEYSHDALRWEYSVVPSSHIYRRRKWWCFKQLLTGESFSKVNPQNRDWLYVKRLEAVQHKLTELVRTEEPLHGQAWVDFASATKESLKSVLSADDNRGHYEVATWFARTLTTALEQDLARQVANVLQMVTEVANSQRFGDGDAALQQLASLLRCEVDPVLSERLSSREGSFPTSVRSTAEECRRVFRTSNIDLPEALHCDEGHLLRVHELLDKLARDPHRWELSQKERNFLWTHRNAQFLHHDSRMLSKVLLATPDWDVDGPDAEALLDQWKKPLTPLGALALLDDRFWWAAKTRFVMSGGGRMDKQSTAYEVRKVCSDETSSFRPFRRYAVERLGRHDGWTDEDFCRYMLQMAVVLRTQMHSFDLVRLLLQRALRSPESVGHALYWHVRAEMCRALADIQGEGVSVAFQIIPSDSPSEIFARLAIILRTFLNLCPSESRGALLDQEEYLVQPLKEIAKTVKARSKSESLEDLKKWMRGELAKQVDIRGELALPVAANTRVTAVVPDKCSILNSATKALWLNFRTVGGGAVNVIFKDGDDLRQDELVLQAFEAMQELWTKAASISTQEPPLLQDGSLSIYRVADLGGEVGMITPVSDAVTLADIFKAEFKIEGGGWLEKPLQVKEIVYSVRDKPEVLYDWVQKSIAGTDVSEEDARKNFMHSCAGYCVATFILGLGDRHSSNIMLQKDGHLVHIDFGWWLGRNPLRPQAMRLLFQAFGASTDYDDDGFAFVPSFAYIIVGPAVWHDDQLDWRQSARFAEFTQLCCECYKVIRNNAHDFINVFSVMLAADIGEEVKEKHGGGDMKLDAAALKTLRDKFRLDVEDAVAADWFKEKIDAALADTTAKALLTNWVLNTLGQMD